MIIIPLFTMVCERSLFSLIDLKALRESKGLSRYQLAKLSGLGESSIQNIENVERPNPTFKTLCKLADALHITLNDFRKDENE